MFRNLSTVGLPLSGRPSELIELALSFGFDAMDIDIVDFQQQAEAFGVEHARRLMLSSTKSQLGHTLGAAGALEAIATIQAIRTGIVPPTINLVDPDPGAAGLDLTPNVAARRDVRVALSNSFGFGGQNSALVFRRWEGA